MTTSGPQIGIGREQEMDIQSYWEILFHHSWIYYTYAERKNLTSELICLLFKCFPAQNLPALWSSVRLQCWLWHNPQPSEHLNSFICLFKTRGKRFEEALSWCLNWDLKGDKQPCVSFQFQNLRVKYLIFSINLFLCVFETRKTL